MADQFAGSRWPFPTGGRPVNGKSYDSERGRWAVVIVEAAAAAMDIDPLEVATLNDRVDPDCVEAIVSGDPVSRDGLRVALEVSFGEITLVLDDEAHIEVSPDGGRSNELVPAEKIEHDWMGPDSLYWTIATIVSEVSDERPIDVVERLLERIDADALDRLLRPLADGTERIDSRLLVSIDGYEVTVTPDGSVEIEPSLAVLRRSGAALLGVGAVPEPALDRASATLLGVSEEQYPVFVLHGRDLDTAERRLSMAGVTPPEGTILDLRATARSATGAASRNERKPTPEPVSGSGSQPPADAPTGSDDRPLQNLEVVPAPGKISALPGTIDDVLGDDASFRVGELRVCVDSLGSIIESTDLETTREALDPLCRTVRTHGGVGQFLLPVAADDERVRRLAPLFDAIVELRTDDVGVEQRWRLTGTGHQTRWFPLR